MLLVPFPSQGHISPLMKLANIIAARGIKVTFVNTEIMHASMMTGRENCRVPSQVSLMSVPDGLQPGDSRRDVKMFVKSLLRVMPGHLQSLIMKLKDSDEKVSCVPRAGNKVC